MSIVYGAARQLLKTVPGLRRFADSPSGQALRYRLALHFEDRPGFTFTQFHRLPAQLDALVGPVLDFLEAHRRPDPIRIVVIGCSTGAEPFTVASVLLERRPQLAFAIDAYDIDPDVLAIARGASYSIDTVHANPLVTADFVRSTFEQEGDRLVVRPEIARRVRFEQADALSPDFRLRVSTADIVMAQNVMCNLRRPLARRLFDNIAALLKQRSALFIDGMDLDMRERCTRICGLVPLAYELQRIHDEARLVRGERYPHFATGLEPFSQRHRNHERRYSTIFLRDS
ncbi:CheR family methyltransferase [Dyella sp.]|uniref:CheR family methyltransferase n=1 Tax=Dyella sp. TaxID=1869338 RepID=UPI002C88CC54|nr:CheR family methyltransferase [Rhodanobacteraceae bacterium]